VAVNAEHNDTAVDLRLHQARGAEAATGIEPVYRALQNVSYRPAGLGQFRTMPLSRGSSSGE
jgi:hypothetical protein